MKTINKIVAGISVLAIATLTTTRIISLSAISEGHIEDNASPIITEQAQTETIQTTTTSINYFQNPSSEVELKEAPDQITDQETILSMMINSIDYFNTVSGQFHQSIAGNNVIIEFSTDIPNSAAYENIQSTNDDKTIYVKNGRSINYDDINQNMTQEGFVAQRNTELVESPSPEIFEYNITVDNEGIKNYIGREQATCLPYARMVLQPTEITFNYLEDLSKWQIKGNENYLGRDCVRIEGTTNDYAHTKLNVASFVFLVDAKTGILLKYEGYDDIGNVSDSVIVDNIQIDSPEIDVSEIITEKLEENKAVYQTYDGYDESMFALLTE